SSGRLHEQQTAPGDRRQSGWEDVAGGSEARAQTCFVIFVRLADAVHGAEDMRFPLLLTPPTSHDHHGSSIPRFRASARQSSGRFFVKCSIVTVTKRPVPSATIPPSPSRMSIEV